MLELREFHRTCLTSKGVADVVTEGQIVTVYDEGQLRGIGSIIRTSDGRIRSAHIRVQSKTGRTTVLKRPVQLLYPLEVCSQERDSADSQPELKPTGVSGDLPSSTRQVNDQDPPMGGTETSPEGRPRRSAAIEARNRILSYVTD